MQVIIIGYFSSNVPIAKKPMVTSTIIVANLLFALLLNLGMQVATGGQASSPYSGKDNVTEAVIQQSSEFTCQSSSNWHTRYVMVIAKSWMGLCVFPKEIL